MAEILAQVDDICFLAKMQETARKLGIELKPVSSGDALLAEAAQAPAGLLIVDLYARQGPLEALEKLHAAGNQTPVIAFLSHVQVELAARARAAGSRHVLPRPTFTQGLPAILP